MAVKTLAVQTDVYERLARIKRGSESFSRLLGRLADESQAPKTGASVLAALKVFPSVLSSGEATAMHAGVKANRNAESWPAHDLS